MKKPPAEPRLPLLRGKGEPLKGYARYTNLAFQMFAIIGAGIFGGVKLDEWLNLSFPVFTLLFSILSVSAAIYSAIKDLIRK